MADVVGETEGRDEQRLAELGYRQPVWYLISAKDRYQHSVRTLEEDVVTCD